MATAPRPGSTKAQSNGTATVERQAFKITVGARTVIVDFDRLGPLEASWVRKATGMSLGRIIGAGEEFDMDSIAVLWWLARIHDGEPHLTWEQACRDFPSYAEAMDAESPNHLEFSELVDDEDDSPEA